MSFWSKGNNAYKVMSCDLVFWSKRSGPSVVSPRLGNKICLLVKGKIIGDSAGVVMTCPKPQHGKYKDGALVYKFIYNNANQHIQ